ncbi:MAG: glycosyl hydrolase 53 family protein [Bacilli bacterium]|nr:glycosyl hydrolase 53 family protein [Bacilli bacterium]
MKLSNKLVLGLGASIGLTLAGVSFYALNGNEVGVRNVANADASSPYSLSLSKTNGKIGDADFSDSILTSTDAKTTSGASFGVSYYHAKGYSNSYCLLDAYNPRTNESGKDGYIYSKYGVNGLDSMTVTYSFVGSVPGDVLLYFSDSSSFTSDPILIESGMAVSVSGSYFKIQALSQQVIISSIDLHYSCDQASHEYAATPLASHSWKNAADITINKPTNALSEDFAFGVDMSMVAETEALGGVYKNENGVAEDPFKILSDDGFNYARLRLWVDPYSNADIAYGGGTNDLATTIHLAKRAKASGMKVLLDLHYSDFWAHPNQQRKPKGWGSTTEAQFTSYTNSVMEAFSNEGISLDAVQVGNEINTGIAGVSSSNALYYTLIQAGMNSVKSAFPSAKVMLHLTNIQSGSASSCVDNLCNNLTDLSKLDAIGVSYYPYWHGSYATLKNVLNLIASKGKEAMVLETSWGFTEEGNAYANNDFDSEDVTDAATNTGTTYAVSEQGQTNVLCDILDVISQVNSSKGMGLFYWGADYIPVSGSSWATDAGSYYASNGADDGGSCTGEVQKQVWSNQALFDYEGKVLGSAQTFRTMVDHGDLGNVTVNITRDEVVTSYDLVYQNDGDGYWSRSLDLEAGDEVSLTLSSGNNINGWYINQIDSDLFTDNGDTATANYEGTYTFNVKDGTSTSNLLTYTSTNPWGNDGILDAIYFGFGHKMNNSAIALYIITGSWNANWLTYDGETDNWTVTLTLNQGDDVSLSSNGSNLRGWYLNKKYPDYFDNTSDSAIVKLTGTYTFTVIDGSDETCFNYYTSTNPWASDDAILSLFTIAYAA